MPRGRDIKPGFFMSDELAEVSRDCRLLFIGLWTLADRDGRVEFRPMKIKAQVFPYDQDVTPARVEAMVLELSAARGRFLLVYEDNGVRCISIVNFKKHQHIHPNEKPSELPEPPPIPVITGKATESSGNYALPSSLLSLPPVSDSPEVSQTKHSEPSEPVLIEFPCAKGETWHLTETVRREMAEAYPAVDVLACARRALEWLRSHPRNLKTRPRMRGWIGSVWCGRQQDKQPAGQSETFRWPKAVAT